MSALAADIKNLTFEPEFYYGPQASVFPTGDLNQRLQLILNAMPVAVVLLDGFGEIVQANKMATQLLDSVLVGQRWIHIIQQRFSPNPVDGHEMLLKNGRLVSLATQSLGQEPGQIIVITDQTETRSLQDKINHNRKLSEMGKMTASLAHQIRTPLATATLYADHLACSDLSMERRIKYAEKLKNRLKLLEKQVNDMLIFSKSGISLSSLLSVGELSQLLNVQCEEVMPASQYCVVVNPDVIASRIRCNSDMLLSVFSNLIENAIQACQEQGNTALLDIELSRSDRRFLSIKIGDNGPGIPADIARQITEPFFTTKPSGTGLGLAVTQAVINAHGGQFVMNNIVTGTGQKTGACAEIKLPLLALED